MRFFIFHILLIAVVGEIISKHNYKQNVPLILPDVLTYHPRVSKHDYEQNVLPMLPDGTHLSFKASWNKTIIWLIQ